MLLSHRFLVLAIKEKKEILSNCFMLLHSIIVFSFCPDVEPCKLHLQEGRPNKIVCKCFEIIINLLMIMAFKMLYGISLLQVKFTILLSLSFIELMLSSNCNHQS